MKIGSSTYSFARLIRNGMKLEEVFDKTKELGYDQTEVGGLRPPDGTDVFEYAAHIRQYCEKIGLEIGCYTVGGDFLRGEGKDPSDEVERLKKEVDIAVALGVDRMRTDVIPWSYLGPMSFRQVKDAISPYIRSVAEYAKTRGIVIGLENHGYFIQEGDRMLALIEAVDHPNFGACIDIGNFLCADDDPIYAVSQLAAYAHFVHVKDFLWKDGAAPSPGSDWIVTRGGNYIRGTIIGHGVVPIPQCIKILRDAGYNGGLSLEFEGPEEPLHAIKASQEYLCRIKKELSV